MSRLSIWWRAGFADAPSEELVAAAGDLDRLTRRRARRLVRRGQAAEDVPVARYAVAFARERQRRWARYPSFGFAVAVVVVLALSVGWFAARDLARSDIQGAALLGGFTVFLLACGLWLPWQERRNAEEAEIGNCEYLRRAGAPYVPGGSPTSVYVAPWVVACSLAVQAAVYIPVGGIAVLLISDRSLSAGTIISAGLRSWPGFAGATVIGFLIARSRNERALAPADR